jgi:hypothetical protein
MEQHTTNDGRHVRGNEPENVEKIGKEFGRWRQPGRNKSKSPARPNEATVGLPLSEATVVTQSTSVILQQNEACPRKKRSHTQAHPPEEPEP